MGPFHGVEKKRRSPGAGQGGRYLAPHQTRLADASDHKAPGAARNTLHRLDKSWAKLFLHRSEALHFHVQNFPGHLQQLILLHAFIHFSTRFSLPAIAMTGQTTDCNIRR
jgi:hypothetical protein